MNIDSLIILEPKLQEISAAEQYWLMFFQYASFKNIETSSETTVIMKNLSEDNIKRNSPKCLKTA